MLLKNQTKHVGSPTTTDYTKPSKNIQNPYQNLQQTYKPPTTQTYKQNCRKSTKSTVQQKGAQFRTRQKQNKNGKYKTSQQIIQNTYKLTQKNY